MTRRIGYMTSISSHLNLAGCAIQATTEGKKKVPREGSQWLSPARYSNDLFPLVPATKRSCSPGPSSPICPVQRDYRKTIWARSSRTVHGDGEAVCRAL